MTPDLGHPISYVALEKRTPVLSSDGHEIGTVAQVLMVPAKDVFDGIVVSRGVSKRPLFADADDVDRIYERGVVLKVSARESENLPEPYTGGYARLKRAWNTISGRR
jgi:uncharacterized protein YrrD